ncbi:sugar phosphate isomerase/epimerase family protein [Flavonifractor sp. HCP28S3_F3]|uniref:sugar phosphate isomerase/epimerase family protein n=1 Tax=Flavonifractor sp. HCP28S3_F3 TaxID=3438939 RepID=UPI003F886CF6
MPDKVSLDRYAVMGVSYLQYSFSAFLDSMAACGFRHLDFWGGAPHYCRLDWPNQLAAEHQLARLRKEIEARGMDVVMYTPETLSYPFSLASPEKPIRKRTEAYFAAACQDALALGVNRLFLTSGSAPRDLSRADSWCRMLESVARIAETARSMGVSLVVEALQPYESNLLNSLSDMEQLLAEVDSPALQVCLDVVAMATAGETMEDWLDRLGRQICWVHFADSNHQVPGEGSLPLNHWLTLLHQRNYQAYIDLEINDSMYWENPHAAMLRTAAWLKGIPGRQEENL